MKNVAIIDYGMSNIGSVRRALEECGAQVFIASEPEQIVRATHCVLPGVGSFADGMRNLVEGNWVDTIKMNVAHKIPLLGICLGMQLLLDTGNEGGRSQGLGLIPGEAVKMNVQHESDRIPHTGWNEIQYMRQDILFNGISEGSDFYFVHSYHVVTDDSYILTRTPYCGGFVSSIRSDIVYGVQFHPEKSQRNGKQLLENFLSI